MNDYEKKYCCMTVLETNCKLNVRKSTNSDWCHIKTIINGNNVDEIVLKSQNMIEQLHFMLGQVLDKQ